MKEKKIISGTSGKKKLVIFRNGVTYFDRKTERLVFFVLTMAMLIFGILTKLGIV